MHKIENSPLGKATVFYDQYKPDLLFPIPRLNNRVHINITDNNKLPFVGVDIWNGYEFSWLDQNGVPQAKLLQILVPCAAPNLVESKSMKLYLYSFANTKFASEAEVIATITQDLSAAMQTEDLKIQLLEFKHANCLMPGYRGKCLDELDVTIDTYDVNPDFISCDATQSVSETLWSNLLKSNCLVTGHPDLGSVRIKYTGPKIDQVGLLKYIISFREHQEFNEHCVERIFCDLSEHCQPQELLVEANYTRRGGLEINPLRISRDCSIENIRLFRQ